MVYRLFFAYCYFSAFNILSSSMKINTKQRAYLRSEAQVLSAIVMVGKEGKTPSVVNALSEALEHHELVKVKFQAFKDEVKDISNALATETASLLVATTGFTSVFYKQSKKVEDRKYKF